MPGGSRRRVRKFRVLVLLLGLCLLVSTPFVFSQWKNAAPQEQQAPGMQQIEGTVQATVESGGWLVTDTATRKTFLLLPGVGANLDTALLQSGKPLRITGYETGEATLFMQGTPFRVVSIEVVP